MFKRLLNKIVAISGNAHDDIHIPLFNIVFYIKVFQKGTLVFVYNYVGDYLNFLKNNKPLDTILHTINTYP